MKLAVITGGTRGIGRAIATRVAALGYRVIAAARHPPGDELPDNTTFAECDVANREQVASLFAPLERIDALITCAGLAGTNPLDSDDALWHAIVASNLHGTYYCCKAAIPRLADDAGRIITMASVLGLAGVPDQTAYCAAKHGVVGLTRALALALAPRGITVNALCPGWVASGMAEQRFRELGITADEAAKGVPTGRIVSVDEVADLAAFLLSPASRSITGQALAIDGGALAGV
ncbi:MAG: SDR family oxidoreductase [Alphaproteobacteria bacterium]|nr:SDR family oxidoreductase [Alphaproteobacteria bacterium]